MKKIPLEGTLVGAYRFLFTRIISIVGTVWLPFVVMAAIIGGLLYVSVPHAWLQGQCPQIHTPQQAIAMLMPLLRIYPGLLLTGLIIASMVMVGLMRHSLGLKKGTTFVYFSLGGPVWRMLGAFVLVYIILMVLLAVLVGIVLVFWFTAVPMMPKGYGLAAGIVLSVIAFCVYVYSSVRLTFFIPAVVVAEGTLGVGRSWQLGGGNFWRIFVIYLLIFIPVGFIASIALQLTVFPALFSVIAKLPHGGGPAHIGEVMRAMMPVLPAIVIVSLLERLAILSLLAGAIGTAYNAVTTPAAETAPAEAPKGE
jgi:hypothetical protein